MDQCRYRQGATRTPSGGTGSGAPRPANARQDGPEARGIGAYAGSTSERANRTRKDRIRSARVSGSSASAPAMSATGDAEQLGVGDRSGGARGEARCGVGQRISVGWAVAAR